MATQADIPTMAARMDDLVQLVRDLLNAVNGLRADFRDHDHGAAYNPVSLRINMAPDTIISGTEQSFQVTSNATINQYTALWDELIRGLGGSAEMINRAKRFP